MIKSSGLKYVILLLQGFAVICLRNNIGVYWSQLQETHMSEHSSHYLRDIMLFWCIKCLRYVIYNDIILLKEVMTQKLDQIPLKNGFLKILCGPRKF